MTKNLVIIPEQNSRLLNTRARSWAFTINNHTFEDLSHMLDNMDADYWCFGFEHEKDDKGVSTPHLQGYAQWKTTSIRFSYIKNIIPRAHIEKAIKPANVNITYCSKEGDFYEFGKRPSQGARQDLTDVRVCLETQPIDVVSRDHFNTFLKYGKMMMTYQYLQQQDRTEPPIVEWVFGPTGSGKSSYAYSKSQSVYFKDHTQWWDGYTQQNVIVIDDFDTRWPFRDLLKLLDRYPYQGQIKGGYVKINSPNIIITCDRTMEQLYKKILTRHELAQLKRRISKEFLIDNRGEYKKADADEIIEADNVEDYDVDIDSDGNFIKE